MEWLLRGRRAGYYKAQQYHYVTPNQFTHRSIGKMDKKKSPGPSEMSHEIRRVLYENPVIDPWSNENHGVVWIQEETFVEEFGKTAEGFL